MPSISSSLVSASYSALIFPVTDFEVVSGANTGDALGPVEDQCLGDIYMLYEDSQTLELNVADMGHRPAEGTDQFMSASALGHQVAEGSELGAPGDTLVLQGRLTFLAPDGDKVDLVLVGHAPADGTGGLYFLPLAPIEPRVQYTLLAASPDAGDVRLADITPVAFTRGTKITLADGTQRAVEDLSPGDTVLTRDNGPQPVRWIGRRTVRGVGACAPVVIQRGTLSNEADLIVSQHQRLFIYRRGPLKLSETSETLIKAHDLVDDETVFIRKGGFVEYFHLAFDRHEIIYAEYIPTESLLVNAANLARLPEDLAHEVTKTLPGKTQQPHFGTEADRSALSRLKGKAD